MTTSQFTTSGLIGKYADNGVSDTLLTLHGFLCKEQLRVITDQETASMLANPAIETGSRKEIGELCGLAIVVGGDGTLLNAARSLADYDVLLAGVNLGHLGFLTDISPNDMCESIAEILRGSFQGEERFLLECRVERAGEYVHFANALNEVVVYKWNVARMIELETYIDEKFVHKLRADGLIIATPTGSTAYALSSGGPIIHPALDATVIVPICPHSMNNRPLVIGSGSTTEVVICASTQNHARVTSDGQVNFELMAGDRVEIVRKPHPIRLLHLQHHNHFELLRAKLHWAETPTRR